MTRAKLQKRKTPREQLVDCYDRLASDHATIDTLLSKLEWSASLALMYADLFKALKVENCAGACEKAGRDLEHFCSEQRDLHGFKDDIPF